MTPPDHLGDDGTPRAGDGVPALSTARLTGLLNGTYATKRQNAAARLAPSPVAFPALSTDVPSAVTPGSYPTGYVEMPYNTPQVTFGGAVFTVNTAGGFNSLRNVVDGPSYWSPFFVEFDYYGQDFSFRGRDNSGGAAYLWLWVDGQPTTAAPVNSTANATGVVFGVRYQWAAARLRRIRLYLRGTDFTALRISPTDSVLPTTLTAPTIAFLGDSWVEGISGVSSLEMVAYRSALYLGFTPYMLGQGGTGYVNVGGKAVFGDPTRLPPLGTVLPDYVVVAGSINDDSSSASAIQAAATSCYAAIRALTPNSRIIVEGPQATTASPSAGRIANQGAVSAAAVAAGLPFVDPIAEGWITGTGKVGATTGTGSADVFIGADGAHPTLVGADALGRRRAQRIAQIITTS
jgi:lysophospholipase L1-like esterase